MAVNGQQDAEDNGEQPERAERAADQAGEHKARRDIHAVELLAGTHDVTSFPSPAIGSPVHSRHGC